MASSNLKKRAATALVLMPGVLYINHCGGLLYHLFLVLILGLSIFEIVKIISNAEQLSRYKKLLWILLISLYAACALLSLMYIRLLDHGRYWVIFLFTVIWMFDSAAYVVGSLIGGPKLIPRISPKKTWAGLIGGCFSVFFMTFIIVKITKEWEQQYTALAASCLSVLIGLVGQAGDLLESSFKRKFGVKDSGKILPGHGGILDRMDSIF
jgi:phosphatidate cytidylyltransferase